MIKIALCKLMASSKILVHNTKYGLMSYIRQKWETRFRIVNQIYRMALNIQLFKTTHYTSVMRDTCTISCSEEFYRRPDEQPE